MKISKKKKKMVCALNWLSTKSGKKTKKIQMHLVVGVESIFFLFLEFIVAYFFFISPSYF